MKLMKLALSALIVAGAVHTGALAQNDGTSTVPHGTINRATDGAAPSSSGHPHAIPAIARVTGVGSSTPSASGHGNVCQSLETPSASGHGNVCQSFEIPSASGHPHGMPTPSNSGHPHTL